MFDYTLHNYDNSKLAVEEEIGEHPMMLYYNHS